MAKEIERFYLAALSYCSVGVRLYRSVEMFCLSNLGMKYYSMHTE